MDENPSQTPMKNASQHEADWHWSVSTGLLRNQRLTLALCDYL
jgi:hypothetical protein